MLNYKHVLHHFMLWILIMGVSLGLTLLSIPFDKEGFQMDRFFIVSMIYLLFYMIAFYSNYFFFFPKFYKESRNSLYMMIIVIWIIVLTYLIAQVEYDYMKQFRNEHVSNDHAFRPDIRWILAAKNFCWIVSMILASTYLKIQERMRKVIVERNCLREEQLRTELKLIKAQINPHFLFNALNNIYSLTYLKSEKAPESVLMLSNMLRYVLDDCSVESVPLSSEINYIENYVAFQQMKSSEKMDIIFEKKQVNTSLRISPMLFIPFVENSFKFSKIDDQKNAFIYIELKTDKSNLHFSIINSISTTPVKSGAHLGIANVKQHLEVLYPAKHELRIEKNDETYSVFLSLDLS